MRKTALALLLTLALAPLATAQNKSILDEYVNRHQPKYGWTVKKVEETAGAKVHRIELTSQVWQGITWKHRLNLVVPPPALGARARPGHALLVITGSGGVNQHITILAGVARQLGVPIAILHDVPNQPLFKEASKNGKGLKEDALIAYTFSKFAQTGDSDWPALLPMARSAVAAMNALGEFSQQQDDWAFGRVNKFVTLGGSKRGWTTWLSAIVDKRVIGIAPIVYDNLNIPEQIAMHMDTWGKPSPSIHDYTDAGLLDELTSRKGNKLLEIVDPYSYKDRLTVPKMAVIGTNDTYWPLEAIHLYRGALPGQLYCHYVPNGGHRVGPSIIQAVVGFFDHVTGRTPQLPDANLTVVPKKEARLELADASRVRTVRVWSTRIDGKDFTKAKWSRVEASQGKRDWRAPLPDGYDTGRAAFLGEVELTSSSGSTFTIHTPVQVWELGPSQP